LIAKPARSAPFTGARLLATRAECRRRDPADRVIDVVQRYALEGAGDHVAIVVGQDDLTVTLQGNAVLN